MKNQNNEILFCAAYITDNEPKTMYFHAKDFGDANAKMIHNWQNALFNNSTKILSIGPAVGAFIDEKDGSIILS